MLFGIAWLTWELFVLIIALIVFIIDIIWQFAIAGIYGPRKARELIINDPLIIKLNAKLDILEQKIVTLEGKSAALQDPSSSTDLDALISDVTEIKDNLSKKFKDLKSSIGGVVGTQVQKFNEALEIDHEGAIRDLDPDSPQNQAIIKDYEDHAKYEMMCQTLSVFMEPEIAERWAYRYTLAPEWLKKSIKKRLNAWTGGLLEQEINI